MKFKSSLFKINIAILIILVSLNVASCDADKPNDIYHQNFDKYVSLYFSDLKIDKTYHQYILLPNSGCGFCINVTQKFIKQNKINNLIVLTNSSKAINLENVYHENTSIESILSRVNLKTQKGPSVLQFINNELVFIESIGAENYQSIFSKIENFVN